MLRIAARVGSEQALTSLKSRSASFGRTGECTGMLSPLGLGFGAAAGGQARRRTGGHRSLVGFVDAGEADLDAGAAERAVGDGDGATMGSDQLGDNGEAEPAPTRVA